MADAKALLEAGLAAREQAKQDAVAAAQRQASEEANHVREAADERISALKREHSIQLETVNRQGPHSAHLPVCALSTQWH